MKWARETLEMEVLTVSVCLSVLDLWAFGFTVSVFMYMSLLLVAVNGCFPLTKTNEFPTLFIFFIANLIEMMTDVQ